MTVLVSQDGQDLGVVARVCGLFYCCFEVVFYSFGFFAVLTPYSIRPFNFCQTYHTSILRKFLDKRSWMKDASLKPPSSSRQSISWAINQ